MDNTEINNKTEVTSSHLQDYEIEVTDKKNFFSTLFDKFKFNKSQKLLASGNHTKTTNKSISSLWGLGNIRTSLFNTLDNVRKAITQKFSSEPRKNTLETEIIGKNSQKENEILKDSKNQEMRISPIIPVTSQEKNANKKTTKVTIEVVNLDTSAVEDKDKVKVEHEKPLESNNMETKISSDISEKNFNER